MDISLKMYGWTEAFENTLVALITEHSERHLISGRIEIQIESNCSVNLVLCWENQSHFHPLICMACVFIPQLPALS